jgi:hypothetical protein
MNKTRIKEILKSYVNEGVGTGGHAGQFAMPLSLGLKKWKKTTLHPYDIEVSHFDNPQLNYDDLDGSLDVSKSVADKMEKMSRNSKKYHTTHFQQNDESVDKRYDLIFERSTSVTSGEYNGPAEIGMKKWNKKELGPFTEFSDHPVNDEKVKNTLRNNLKRIVGVWEKGEDGTYDVDINEPHSINEDLAVWFGTKKKPKGSKQPKGPWVNICRKVDGKHPPCGRPEASDRGYPKCRAVGVASKMSDSQKKSACAQKRKAEKTHSKTGTGNKPKMVSYKPKKKNESISENIKTMVRQTLLSELKK